MPGCSSCGELLPKSSFATAQLKKPAAQRKCKPCAAAAATDNDGDARRELDRMLALDARFPPQLVDRSARAAAADSPAVRAAADARAADRDANRQQQAAAPAAETPEFTLEGAKIR